MTCRTNPEVLGPLLEEQVHAFEKDELAPSGPDVGGFFREICFCLWHRLCAVYLRRVRDIPSGTKFRKGGV